MFTSPNKTEQLRTESDLLTIAHIAGEEIRERWLSFNAGKTEEHGSSLSRKIGMFIPAMAGLFEEKYPMLMLGGKDVFISTVAGAIQTSGTHARAQIDAAVERYVDR
jgi:hypothetical protein